MENVLRSRTFSRSDQLKRFLHYVCEKDIEGRADECNEYAIAVEALGRPPGYSPSDDSSVRTRAHALRQKLQEYYELEDPDATIRIDIPKGGYTPHYSLPVPVAVTPLLEAVEPAPPVTILPARVNPWKPFLAGALSVSVVAALAFGIFILKRGGTSAPPLVDVILRSAWGTMLNPGVPVEVCIAAPPAMLLHSYPDGRLPSTIPLLPAPKDVASWYDSLQMLDGGGRLYMHTTQDVFLFGDSLAATSAVQLISRSGALPHVVPESSLGAFALRGKNVVLIGSPNYSPVAARLLMNTPFSVHYDSLKREEVVSDGVPEQGAHHIYRPVLDRLGRLRIAYGLVTVLPSQVLPDNKSQILIFSGITSAGPQAGLEFFASPEGLRVLASKLRQSGYSRFPRAYQVVVRCGLDHNLALSWEYESHRVIEESTLLN